MINRARELIAQGEDVRIFSARANPMRYDMHGDYLYMIMQIKEWCRTHIGKIIPIEFKKDEYLKYYYDDKAKQVVRNEGIVVEDIANVVK